jgi:hypothetical protein
VKRRANRKFLAVGVELRMRAAPAGEGRGGGAKPV